MKLIVGLGNPGNKYEGTLHNVGFSAIERVAEKSSLYQWKDQFKSKLVSGNEAGEQFILLKPQTYMNLSGEAVQACKHYYKIELDEILVVFDDLDLPQGKLRYRSSGGHGGHNGVRSILQHCGGPTFHRLRIGIGRPAHGKVSDYVLSKPSLDGSILVGEAIDYSTQYIHDFIRGTRIQISS